MASLPPSMKDPLPKAVLQTPKRSWGLRMLPEKKKLLFPEIFRPFDPDDLVGFTDLPVGMREQAEEIFGDWIKWDRLGGARPPDPTKEGWLKLRPHPWHGCWTMFQWAPEFRDTPMGWVPTFVFMESPIDGQLPTHLLHDNSDGRFDNLKGKIGERKLPNKVDFEQFYKVSNRSLFDTAWDQTMADMSDQEKAAADKENAMRDYELDLCQYYADERCREANRFYGGMQGLPFVPQTSYDEILRNKENRDYVVEFRPRSVGEGYIKVKWKKTHWDKPSLPPYRVLTPEGKFETIVAELGPGPVRETLESWLDKNGYRVVSDEEELVLRRQREYATTLESLQVK